MRALGWHLGRLLGRILPLRYFGRSGLAFGGLLGRILPLRYVGRSGLAFGGRTSAHFDTALITVVGAFSYCSSLLWAYLCGRIKLLLWAHLVGHVG